MAVFRLWPFRARLFQASLNKHSSDVYTRIYYGCSCALRDARCRARIVSLELPVCRGAGPAHFSGVRFVASTYTTLRTLLPLLPGHPLVRRSVDAPEADKRPRLKSAQRFTAYLSLVDIGER